MARLLRSKLFWSLVSGGVLCAGQSERAIAMQWADYYAAVYRVPPDLVHAIIEVESAWQRRAVSNKGAAGLMQLMPATAVTFAGSTGTMEINTAGSLTVTNAMTVGANTVKLDGAGSTQLTDTAGITLAFFFRAYR